MYIQYVLLVMRIFWKSSFAQLDIFNWDLRPCGCLHLMWGIVLFGHRDLDYQKKAIQSAIFIFIFIFYFFFVFLIVLTLAGDRQLRTIEPTNTTTANDRRKAFIRSWWYDKDWCPALFWSKTTVCFIRYKPVVTMWQYMYGSLRVMSARLKSHTVHYILFCIF